MLSNCSLCVCVFLFKKIEENLFHVMISFSRFIPIFFFILNRWKDFASKYSIKQFFCGKSYGAIVVHLRAGKLIQNKERKTSKSANIYSLNQKLVYSHSTLCQSNQRKIWLQNVNGFQMRMRKKNSKRRIHLHHLRVNPLISHLNP